MNVRFACEPWLVEPLINGELSSGGSRGFAQYLAIEAAAYFAKGKIAAASLAYWRSQKQGPKKTMTSHKTVAWLMNLVIWTDDLKHF